VLSEDGAHLTLHQHSTAVRRVGEMAWGTLAAGASLRCGPGGTCQVSGQITPAVMQAAQALVLDINLAEFVIEVRVRACRVPCLVGGLCGV
jgi:hypothetical protein